MTRRIGHGKPLESSAARTRSPDSRTAASGRRTMVEPGRPLGTWTSTETRRPAPVRVAAEMEASMHKKGRMQRACGSAVRLILAPVLRLRDESQGGRLDRAYPTTASPRGGNWRDKVLGHVGLHALGAFADRTGPWKCALFSNPAPGRTAAPARPGQASAYGFANSRDTSRLPTRRANRSTIQTTIAANRITEVVTKMSGKCPGSESNADHIFSG